MAASQVEQYVRDAKALADVVLRIQGDLTKAERLARQLRYESNGEIRTWDVFGTGAVGGGIDAGARDILGWFAENREDSNSSSFDIDAAVRDLDEFMELVRYAAERQEVTA